MQQQEKEQMTLLFVGDMMLGRLVNAVLRKQSLAYPWGDTFSLFRLTFRLNPCEARLGAVRAIFNENRMNPLYKLLDAKLV